MKRIGKRMVAVILCATVLCGAYAAGNFIYCMAEIEGEYRLPILMYHHILKDKGKQGAYVISPEEFREDLSYLKETGYTAIGTKELLAYQEKGEPLPEKPVMLTFDDGYLSYMEYAVPLLEQYGMKAVVSVVGSYADTYTENKDSNVSYAYLTWEDIRALSGSSHTEIQNHTYDMHKVSHGQKGCARLKGEKESVYRERFTSDVSAMQTLLKQYTEKEAVCFTYPFGFCCGEAEEEIKNMGFRMSLCCAEGVNLLEKTSSLFMLKRFNRAHKRSAESILKSLD
ncbi:MAG: polysaccharide deacetylase family protein [Clostridia bacterium]|nr:polysaccharide deacetylase family protein [Clostridia bacterium]